MRYFGKFRDAEYIASDLPTSASSILQFLRTPRSPFKRGPVTFRQGEEVKVYSGSFMGNQRGTVRCPAVTYGRTTTGVGRPQHQFSALEEL